MELFNDQNSMAKVSSPMKKADEADKLIKKVEDLGLNLVELNDFYRFLDEKTILKIKQTTAESIERISKDVAQIEYEIDGAQAIMEMLN